MRKDLWFELLVGGSGAWTLYCGSAPLCGGHVPRRIFWEEAAELRRRQLRRLLRSAARAADPEADVPGSASWRDFRALGGGDIVFEGDIAALARFVGLPAEEVERALERVARARAVREEDCAEEEPEGGEEGGPWEVEVAPRRWEAFATRGEAEAAARLTGGRVVWNPAKALRPWR